MYMNLEKKMCRELDALEEKYRTNAELSESDLRRADLLLHSLKSMATYKAMREAEEMNNQSYGMNPSRSGGYDNSYRGRDNMGRYTSNDMSPDMSGHMFPPYYREERRW